MILEDSIVIQAGPEAVFQFFVDIENHYLAWHPDHVLFRWEDGRGGQLGSIFYFEEHIGGRLLKKRCVYTRIVPNEHLEFAPTFWLMRLILPRMLFRMVPENGGCRLIQQIQLRLGPLAQWLKRKELAAVREHMRAEGLSAKRMIEAKVQHPGLPRAEASGPA